MGYSNFGCSTRIATTVEDAPVLLLVDDDEHARSELAERLVQHGFDVIELGDGIEALNYMAAACVYRDCMPRPDLILSAIFMPTFSGLDLLAGLREGDDHPPVVLFTEFDDDELVDEAHRLGADRVVLKPDELTTFGELVARLFAQRYAPGAPAEHPVRRALVPSADDLLVRPGSP